MSPSNQSLAKLLDKLREIETQQRGLANDAAAVIERAMHLIGSPAILPPRPSEGQWITQEEAIRLGRMSVRTLSRYVKSGKVRRKHQQVPGRKPMPLFSRDDISAQRSADF